jgi:hypothetical protein
MISRHAGRVGKQFFLWGESPSEKEIQGARRGRKPKNQAGSGITQNSE